MVSTNLKEVLDLSGPKLVTFSLGPSLGLPTRCRSAKEGASKLTVLIRFDTHEYT